MHVGIIMDGNGRWATRRRLARLIGHKNGAKQVKEIVKSSPSLGVNTLTLYAFSTENWKRAAHEVEGLMKLFRRYLRDNFDKLHENDVRVRFLGDPTPLAQDICKQMDDLAALTRDNTGLNLNIAINYGGQDELVRSIRKIAQKAIIGEISPDEITPEMVSAHLDTAGQNDPDLIIRTAGEMRLSNFLTWQSAYSELVFVEETWPEFTTKLFGDVLDGFHQRTRRFGAVPADAVAAAE